MCSGSRSYLPATSYFDSSFYRGGGTSRDCQRSAAIYKGLKNSKIIFSIIIFLFIVVIILRFLPYTDHVGGWSGATGAAPVQRAIPQLPQRSPFRQVPCLLPLLHRLLVLSQDGQHLPSHHPHSPTTVTCHCYNSHNYEDINDLSLANIGDLFIQVVRHTHAPRSLLLRVLYIYIYYISIF